MFCGEPAKRPHARVLSASEPRLRESDRGDSKVTALNSASSPFFTLFPDTSASYRVLATMLVSSEHILATDFPMDVGGRWKERRRGCTDATRNEADAMRHHVAGGDKTASALLL